MQRPQPIPPRQVRKSAVNLSSLTSEDKLVPKPMEAPNYVQQPIKEHDMVRLDTPTGDMPYNGKAVGIRTLSWTEYAQLAVAVRSKNTTALLDAIDKTVNASVRNLAIQDWRSALMWHRVSSFTSIPITVTWTSAYAGRTDMPVDNSMFDTKKIEMTVEEYKEYYAKGLDFPRVADMEFMEAPHGLSEEQRFLTAYAQFVRPDLPEVLALLDEKDPHPSMFARLRWMETQPVSALMDLISKFDTAMDCGIREIVQVTVSGNTTREDAKRNLPAALQVALQDGDEARAKWISDEMIRLEQTEQGWMPAPERVVLPFDAWTLFPL